MPSPTDRQAFADALERRDTAAAYAVYLALAAENARLRDEQVLPDTLIERACRTAQRAGYFGDVTVMLTAFEAAAIRAKRPALTPEPDHA